MHVEWEADEYTYREKTNTWYWASIGIAIVALAFAVWQKNFLFGFFIVIAEVLVLFWGGKEPRRVRFVLTDEALLIGDYQTYTYDAMESFSVFPGVEDGSRFVIRFKKRFKPSIAYIVPEGDVEMVRSSLGSVVHETEADPSLLDSIEDFIRF